MNKEIIPNVLITRLYDVPCTYPYVAFNRDGVFCGFFNAPVRDMKEGMWIDSVTGSPGEIIYFERWHYSLWKSSELHSKYDTREGFRKKALEAGEKSLQQGPVVWLTCKQCGHGWSARIKPKKGSRRDGPGFPKQCPKCDTTAWNSQQRLRRSNRGPRRDFNIENVETKITLTKKE